MSAETTSRSRATTRKKTSTKGKRTKRTAEAGEAAELRSRWEAARRVIREVVSEEDQHDPRIWERGVYQLWLWLLVEMLVVRRDEIEVGDLSAISKMLHEQRKLTLDEDKHRHKAGEPEGNGTAGTPQLPEHFGELVRQIYGTNFQDDATVGEVGAADSRG